jgi:hypothetical protein
MRLLIHSCSTSLGFANIFIPNMLPPVPPILYALTSDIWACRSGFAKDPILCHVTPYHLVGSYIPLEESQCFHFENQAAHTVSPYRKFFE